MKYWHDDDMFSSCCSCVSRVFIHCLHIYRLFIHFVCSYRTPNKHCLNASSKLATDFTKKCARDKQTKRGYTFQYLLNPSLSLTFDQCQPKDWSITPSLQDSIDQKVLLNCFLIDPNKYTCSNKLARIVQPAKKWKFSSYLQYTSISCNIHCTCVVPVCTCMLHVCRLFHCFSVLHLSSSKVMVHQFSLLWSKLLAKPLMVVHQHPCTQGTCVFSDSLWSRYSY